MGFPLYSCRRHFSMFSNSYTIRAIFSSRNDQSIREAEKEALLNKVIKLL